MDLALPYFIPPDNNNNVVNETEVPITFIQIKASPSMYVPKAPIADMFVFFLSLLLLLRPSDSVYFSKTRFEKGDPDILCHGDAVPSGGSIELNKIGYTNRVGWATYAHKVRLWDGEEVSDFKTHFSFTIDTLNQSTYSDGIAFFLAPTRFEIPPNSAAGFMGLFNTTEFQNQIVFVEFDTYPNPDYDPSTGHVGINENSLSSSVSVPWDAGLFSGETAQVWVSYNATTMNMSVFWTYDGTSNPRQGSILTYRIDLKRALPEWVMVGFSASTGVVGAQERHVLRSWEFSSSLAVEEEPSSKKISVVVIASISGSICVVVIGAIVGFVVLRRRRAKSRESEVEERVMKLASISDDLERGLGPRRFLHNDLVSATNNFSDNRKLGEGGFGAVYKGYLIDIDMAIAVKKVSRGSKQGKKEYITEVQVFSRLRHRNLVQLLGWCHDNNELLLVYEFMPNGSLDAHLFGQKSPLPWPVRHKITLGLAAALLYLHEEWEQCVVHRDIKTSNIMLDSSFSVKLGDFGLARLMDHELGPRTTGVAGTFGYLAPEYVSTGRASKESDVFSFGVVALEIATGRRSVDPVRKGEEEMGLVEWVWELYGEGQLGSAIDEKLEGSGFDENEVQCLMIVGLWCAYPDHGVRPSIRQAMQVLSFEAAMPDLPRKMPALLYHVSMPKMDTATWADSGETCVATS